MWGINLPLIFFYSMNISKILISFIALLLPFTSVIAQTESTIFVEPVINSIRVGDFVGNKNLGFGVKNIAEEVLIDQDQYILLDNKDKAEYTLQLELIFFDVVTKSRGISVFHKEVSTTVIKMKGILYKNGVKISEHISQGESNEISTSTILIDEGGNFNEQTASSPSKEQQ